MKQICKAICLIFVMSSMGMAAPRALTPSVQSCLDSIVDSRVFMTAAMLPITAQQAGRPDADPRAVFYQIPWENLVFSRLSIMGLEACTSISAEGVPGWDEDAVAEKMERFGLISSPDCSAPGMAVWLLPARNARGYGVSAVVLIESSAVKEIMVWETPNVTDPQTCGEARTQ